MATVASPYKHRAMISRDHQYLHILGVQDSHKILRFHSMLLYSLLGILLSQAFYARIAQLAVQLICNQQVAGLSPVSGTIRLVKV